MNISNTSRIHRQQGHAIWIMTLLAETGLLLYCGKTGEWIPGLFFSLLLGFLLISFFSLEIKMEEDTLILTVGLTPMIRRRIPLTQIVSVKNIQHPLFSGWGISRLRSTKGMSYNVTGWKSVELRLKDGSVLRIGTHKPEELIAMISEAIPR